MFQMDPFGDKKVPGTKTPLDPLDPYRLAWVWFSELLPGCAAQPPHVKVWFSENGPMHAGRNKWNIWISGYLDSGKIICCCIPTLWSVWCSPAGGFFFRKNTFLDFLTSFRWFPEFLNSKKTRNVNKPGYPKYEPVMFDMDSFGDKKVPCTKYLDSISLSRLID